MTILVDIHKAVEDIMQSLQYLRLLLAIQYCHFPFVELDAFDQILFGLTTKIALLEKDSIHAAIDGSLRRGAAGVSVVVLG